jgi:hypothetical protein
MSYSSHMRTQDAEDDRLAPAAAVGVVGDASPAAPAKKAATVQVGGEHHAFLAARGARAAVGPGTFRCSAVLRRTLRQLAATLAAYDPTDDPSRIDPGLLQVILRTLPTPWRLTVFEIEKLSLFLDGIPAFVSGLAALDLAPTTARRQIDALSYVEKVALVDATIRFQVAAGEAPRRRYGVGP